MTKEDKVRDLVVGGGDALGLPIMSNVLAALLDGQPLVASTEDLGKYDGRVVRIELVGPDSDPFAALCVSLVPA